MARATQSRRVAQEKNLFGGLFKKLTAKQETYRRSASKGSTFSADARKSARADQQRKRAEHLEDLRYEKEAARLRRELAKLDTKLNHAEKTIDAAKSRERGGKMTEAEFERVKARQEAEIRKYEEGKRKALAALKNPSLKQQTIARKQADRARMAAAGKRTAKGQNPTSHMRPASTKWRNAAGAGRGGAATGAGAGGAGGGAGAGSQGGASRTEVRSPTSTSTSTEAETTGNITVTGGAGAGAHTTVKITKANPLYRKLSALVKKSENPPVTTRGGQTIQISITPSSRRKGWWDLFVGGTHRVTKKTKRGAEGYAKRILEANPRNAGRYSKRKHKKFMKGRGFSGSDIQFIRSKGKKKGKQNPLEAAAELSEKFTGRPATSVETIREKLHKHQYLTKLGDLARLVVDTPTGKVVYLNFNTTDPKKIVRLASSEDRDPKTKAVIGKQLYLRGGDQEVNLKAMGMDSPEWIRDKMELGRLHEFPKGAKEGSIVYRARKKYNNFKLTDWWHKAGEDSGADNEAAAALLRQQNRKQISGPAARPLLVYDHKNKLLEIVGGQYFVDAPGIIN